MLRATELVGLFAQTAVKAITTVDPNVAPQVMALNSHSSSSPIEVKPQCLNTDDLKDITRWTLSL